MSHVSRGAKVQQGYDWNWLNWPVIGGNVTVITFFHSLWEAMPAPTVVYTIVTTLFMLFQMADKLGWLDSFKRGGRRVKPGE